MCFCNTRTSEEAVEIGEDLWKKSGTSMQHHMGASRLVLLQALRTAELQEAVLWC